METFFNNGSMTMIFQIMNVDEGLGGRAKKLGGVRNLGTEESSKNHTKKNSLVTKRSQL